MEAIFFWVLAVGLLVSATALVAFRNPVTNAVCLVVALVMQAALFITLESFFLAAVQVIVYAGAVMVLFLFVIMLLDLKEEERRRIRVFGWVAGLISVGSVALLLLGATRYTSPATGLPPPRLEGTTEPLGRLLFTEYLLPFEILSVLLLAAMVGVILLSRKDSR